MIPITACPNARQIVFMCTNLHGNMRGLMAYNLTPPPHDFLSWLKVLFRKVRKTIPPWGSVNKYIHFIKKKYFFFCHDLALLTHLNIGRYSSEVIIPLMTRRYIGYTAIENVHASTANTLSRLAMDSNVHAGLSSPSGRR